MGKQFSVIKKFAGRECILINKSSAQNFNARATLRTIHISKYDIRCKCFRSRLPRMCTWCVLNNLTETKCDRNLHRLHANHKISNLINLSDVQLIVLFTPSYWVLNKIHCITKDFSFPKFFCYNINITVLKMTDENTLIIETFKTPRSLYVDVYEHVYVHASVYVLTAARASLPCLPLTVLHVMLMTNTVLMRWAVSSHLINRAMRKPRKERLRKCIESTRKISGKMRKEVIRVTLKNYFQEFIYMFISSDIMEEFYSTKLWKFR